ncbi:hypothetical protein D3C84_907080 [compost metagenome]
MMEILLKYVSHHIHHAIDRMVFWSAGRKYRIKDGERWISQYVAPAMLLKRLLIGNNRTGIHLGARSCKREDSAKRQSCLRLRFTRYDIPEVPLVFRSDNDRFGAVNRAAAANRKYPVDRLGTA